MTDEFIRKNIEPTVREMENGDFYSPLSKLARKLGAKIESGASRICLIFKDDDEVIKIPFSDETRTDYCARELENYERAKEYGIQSILLPVRKFAEYDNGAAIYVQTKYTFATSEAYFNYYNYKRQEQLYNKAIHCKLFQQMRKQFYISRVSTEWFMFVYTLYGKDFCRRLIKWTKECEVNDLHNSNTGFYKGKPIILDYAGYNDFSS